MPGAIHRKYTMSDDWRNTSYPATFPGLLLTICGGLVLAGGVWLSPERAWSNLLVAMFYLVSLGLGGAVFVAMSYVTGASWSVAFRRVPEAIAGVLPVAGVGIFVVLAMHLSHYAWHPHPEEAMPTYWFKELWLEQRFFAARALVCIALWILFAGMLRRLSRRQDVQSDAATTRVSTRVSAGFLFLFAVTYSIASMDWLMALEPLWFSTMWAVYQFSGMMLSTIAAIVVLCLALRNAGPLRGIFSDEHLHDLGKLLIAFSCFWMYIWFSQFMLIWYTNIPEETAWFIRRTNGPWLPVVVASLVMNWGIPFFVLLPKPAKRSASVMMKIAVLVLIGRWVDLYVTVFPATIGASPVFGACELAAIAAAIGLFVVLFLRVFTSAAVVPRNEPYLSESLHYHA
jgi:hypothetical protein